MKGPNNKKYIQSKTKRKMYSHANPTKFKTTTALKAKRPPSVKQKGSVYFKHHQFSYRLPMIIMMLSLIVLILVIPSLIVMPFGKDTSMTREAEEGQSEVIGDSEAISVAVMRTKADVVEDVLLENYIVGVVAAEMPIEFEMEALKAQALAARTYTVSHLMGENKDDSYDITDTIQHQVYKNDIELQKTWGSSYEDNIKKIRSAVKETEGEILTYNDKPIMPAFFSMSNGFTENSEDYWENELPYLRSVKSSWEIDNPKFISQETFSTDKLSELLEMDLAKTSTNDIVISRKPSERVDQFTLGDDTFTGREIRDKLGLRSSDFSVKQKDNIFIFTTKGYGHGVGMSQYGADAMAKEGKDYQEIVKYYYQDIEISDLNETVPTLVSR